MANPMEGYANLGNINHFKGFNIADQDNNTGVKAFGNIDNIDNFIKLSDDPELLKGAITKIQQGEGIENIDMSGLSVKDAEFVNDLNSVKGVGGPQDVAEKFSDLVGKYMENADQKHKAAEQAVTTLASGGNIDVHSVMMASEKASLSMQLTMQLRNKLLQAYRQIQQIRV